MNLRDAIQNTKFVLRAIDVPGWGEKGTFFLRPILFKDQQAVSKLVRDAAKNNDEDVSSEVIVFSILKSLCNESGVLVLKDCPEDRELIASQAVDTLNYLMKEINALNGFDENAPVEGAIKN